MTLCQIKLVTKGICSCTDWRKTYVINIVPISWYQYPLYGIGTDTNIVVALGTTCYELYNYSIVLRLSSLKILISIRMSRDCNINIHATHVTLARECVSEQMLQQFMPTNIICGRVSSNITSSTLLTTSSGRCLVYIVHMTCVPSL